MNKYRKDCLSGFHGHFMMAIAELCVVVENYDEGWEAAWNKAQGYADTSNLRKLARVEDNDVSMTEALEEEFPEMFRLDFTLDDLNEEQARRLVQYALDHGRDWRRKLNNAWQDGHDANQPEGHLLRQIRNQFGPVWLSKLTIVL